MSCKWGSEYVWIGNEDYDTINMDENARLITEENKRSIEENKKLIQFDGVLEIPQKALHIVTNGELTQKFRVENYKSTIGCAFKISSMVSLGGGKFAKAQLWDTAGQERFRTIGRAYYRGADVTILVYDISDSNSGQVNNLRRWYDEVKDANPNSVSIILGNKLDLSDQRGVSREEVERYAEEMGVYFSECSAKTGENLSRAFARMYSEAYMNAWSRKKPFELLKIVVVGDSGVGKTSLFDRLDGFSMDLSPLAEIYPIFLDYEYESSARKGEEKKPIVPSRKKWVLKADTNVISLNLGHLGAWSNQCELATGDPELCTMCGAALAKITKISTDEKKWYCNFCRFENDLHLEPEEIPQTNDVDFLERGTPSASNITDDDSFVVFCLDTSGSMTVAEPIDSKDAKNLRKIKQQLPDRTAQDSTSQYLPNEKQGVVYISRLEAVQSAIEAQLVHLQHEHPNRGAALVTFSSDVTVFGDGTHEPIVHAGDRLHSPEELENLDKWWPRRNEVDDKVERELSMEQKLKLASATTKQEIISILNQANSKEESESSAAPQTPVALQLAPIIKSRMALSTKLFSLSEEGQTALGPALLVSCSIAARKRGSKVILCTDGLANVGVGSMDGQDPTIIKSFYRTIAEKALNGNTSIYLMGFKGSQMNIEVLGEMATKTGGQVDIVDPAQVHKNLKGIFADDTVATDVVVKLYLPRGITLRESTAKFDDWKPEKDEMKIKEGTLNIFTKSLGNINSDTNLLLQFETNISLIDDLTIPFQFQINYTRAEDGKRLMRIISRMIPTCKTREEAEKTADPEVIALNAVRVVALTAQNGSYTKSRLQNYAHNCLLRRIADVHPDQEEVKEVLKSYAVHYRRFDDTMRQEQLEEIRNGRAWDDTEAEMKELAVRFGVDTGTEGVLDSVLSSVGSFFSGWWTNTTTTTTTTTPTTTTIPTIGRTQPTEQNGREVRGDGVSNMLWNMRGANML